MDRVRRKRKPVRAAVTRISNEIEGVLTSENPDLDNLAVQTRLLEKKKLELSELDQMLLDLMLDAELEEDEYEKECEDIDEYEKKTARTMHLSEKLLQPPVNSPLSRRSSEPTFRTTCSGEHKKRAYRLPKTEIKKFGGAITDWLSWWAQYSKIHDDEELHDADKFQYLQQSIVEDSKAAELVKVYPQTAANYPKVIQALKDRFGNEKILKRVYVRELLKMIIKNSREKIQIGEIFDKLEGHLKALESLGITSDQMDIILFPMVESCLPDEILTAWQRCSNYGRDGRNDNPPRTEFEYMLEFVKREVEYEGQRELAQAGFENLEVKKKGGFQKQVKTQRSDIPTAASLLSKNVDEGCLFCGKRNHQPKDCFKANKMSIPEKRAKVKDSHCCFVCLSRGHYSKNCRANIKCPDCERRHHKVMCPGPPIEEPKVGTGSMEQSKVVQPSLANHQTDRVNKLVLMKTLQVQVVEENGRTKTVRLLFDEGSQSSYIKTSVAEEMQCPVAEKISLQNALFGGYLTKVKTRNKHNVTIQGMNGKYRVRRQLKLVNEDVICTACPKVPIGPWTEELARRNIFISDTETCTPEIQILIGSDLWGSLMTGKMVKLTENLIAVESIFGWTLSGEVPHLDSVSYAMTTISMLNNEEKSLPDLWKLDVLGIRDSAEKISEEEHDMQVKKQVQDGMNRDQDGRYHVGLPWIMDSQIIPSNKEVCKRRLMAATEKLVRTGHMESYSKVFSDWESEGIIKAVSEESNEGHFLPHRPVFKLESLTTPVRPVFDASCRVGRSPSLNQCLEKGPNMMELLPAILLRFRDKEVGVISDIRKAFQMVGVKQEDQKFQKFLWWEDWNSKKLKVYQHCRVVFGLNCSPFLLAAVMDQHLSGVGDQDQAVARILGNSLYVDNCVCSLQSKMEYMKFKEQAAQILDQGKFELRQWESNVDLSSDNGNESHVLGVIWDKKEDTLRCEVPKKYLEEFTVTKRNVLSLVSQVFDPIGVTCPATLQAKLMLQKSWSLELNWDAEWDDEGKRAFWNWKQQLGILSQVRIPRCVLWNGNRDEIAIHTFCDASQDAYAAVVYARVKHKGKVMVQLLQAKTRLAPLNKKKEKRVTINRLELMSCLIGARLTEFVKQSLSMEGVKTYLWSDSSNALAWIRRDEDWGTFVGNRVREINRITKSDSWRHVPGIRNPADLPSRGCTPTQLLETRWWEGPSCC